MMMSPYVYTENLLKDASVEKILTTIEEMRLKIKTVKEELESYKFLILVSPGPDDRLFFQKCCLQEAIKLLEKRGYTCEPTEEELQKVAFEKRLRGLSSIIFEVKIDDRLHHIYKLEIDKDVLRYSMNKTPQQPEMFHFIQEKPKTERFSSCLEGVIFSEWRSQYVDQEERYIYIDGKPFERTPCKEMYRLPFTFDFFQWSITLTFEDDSPPCHYQGENAVAYHLDDFMRAIFDLSWEKLEKLSE